MQYLEMLNQEEFMHYFEMFNQRFVIDQTIREGLVNCVVVLVFFLCAGVLMRSGMRKLERIVFGAIKYMVQADNGEDGQSRPKLKGGKRND